MRRLNDVEKIIMREWEERIVPSDLAEDREFLGRLASVFDKRGRRVFDLILKNDGRVAIKARNYVGIFAVKDSKGRDVVLIVEPKIGVKNIVWMLAFNEARSFNEVREIEAMLSKPVGRESIMDLLIIGLIRSFTERLSQALVYGFAETSLASVEESPVIRGRILSSVLLRTLLSSPIPNVAYEIQYFTTDNILNHYILDACYMLYNGASDLLKIADVNETVLRRALLEFDYSPLGFLAGDISPSRLLNEMPLDRPYLHDLLRLASIIRRWLEQGRPPYPGEFVSVPALYINMNKLFERFVRKAMILIAKWLRRSRNINIAVRKAGREERALVVLPKRKTYLNPDIVIEVNGRPIAIGDVKYKLVKDPLESGPKGDREGVSQVFTYIHGWNVEKGLLVYPSVKNETSYHRYILTDERKLYVVRLHVNERPKTFKELRTSKIFKVLSDLLLELVS